MKQKHWIFLKYRPTRSGVTLNVAWPTIGWSDRFSASKNTSDSWPRCTVTLGCTGLNRQGMPGATSVLNETVTVRTDSVAVSDAARSVVPKAPVAWQNKR